MPGYGDPPNRFSKENQPLKRKEKNPLTKILRGKLDEDTFVILEGKLVEDLGNGNVKVKVKNPNKEALINAMLRNAMKGNAKAQEIIFDRIEGKVVQQNQELPPPLPPKYNLSLLSQTEIDELEKIEIRRNELLDKCENITTDGDTEE